MSDRIPALLELVSARLEAVAKAIADQNGWTSYTDARKAISAADEVMFSEAMETKVAELLSEARRFTWQVQASMIFQLLRGEA